MIKHNYSITIYKENKGIDQLDTFTMNQISYNKLLKTIEQTINEISELYNFKPKNITVDTDNKMLMFSTSTYLITAERID